MKRLIVTASMCGLLVIAAGTPGEARWLTAARMVDAQAYHDYRADVMVERPLRHMAPERLRIWHDRNGRERVEWLGQNGRVQQARVLDRQITWCVNAKTCQVSVSATAPEPPSEARARLLEKNYRLIVLGQGRTLGRTVLLARWQPRHPDNLMHRMWVDLTTALPIYTERLLPGGQVLDRCRFTRFTAQLRLNSDAWHFRLPPGGHAHSPIIELARGDARNVRQALSGTSVTVPSRLPGGYALYAWRHLTHPGGHPFWACHYHDGLNVVSLAISSTPWIPSGASQTVTQGDWQGQAFTEFGQTTLLWRTKGLNLGLVGYRTPATLASMAVCIL